MSANLVKTDDADAVMRPAVLQRLRPAAIDLLLAAGGVGLLIRQFLHAMAAPGIDFVHVWRATHHLLAGAGAYGDPLFTYPPGSALILAPLGALDYRSAHLVMLIANAIAVAWATWLVLGMLQGEPTRRAIAVALLALGVSVAVASTWANDNVNGILLLLQVVALRSMHRGRWYAAAALLGITLTIKPVLVALLVMFAVRRKWRALALAVAIPGALTGLGWLLVRDSSRYVHVVVPYLLHGAEWAYNDSFVGAGRMLSVPAGLVTCLRLAAVAAAALVALARLRRRLEPSTRGLCAETGVLLAATFLAAPMSETYYTIYLIPAIAAWATMSRRSAWVAAFTVAVCFATFELPGGSTAHTPLSVPLAVRPTLGWLACLAAFTVIARRAAAPPLATPYLRLAPAAASVPAASVAESV